MSAIFNNALIIVYCGCFILALVGFVINIIDTYY